MRQVVTKGIVLTRTDYGEADRILTFLTPDHGKVRALAKGVRKSKSKLAGGIELFSVSHISYIVGRGDINTLTSTRLEQHYGHIVKDVERTMFGYELLKSVNRATEDQAGEEYFILLQNLLAGLDDSNVPLPLLSLWFYMQLLKLGGHSPNLKTDTAGDTLQPDQKYTFSFDDMAFAPHPQGPFSAAHIKLLRLAISLDSPNKLIEVGGVDEVLATTLQLASTMLTQFIHI